MIENEKETSLQSKEISKSDNNIIKLKNKKSQEDLKIYDMEQWQKDGDFKAKPGQQISEEIYNQMLNALPPKNIPRKKAEQALQDYNVPVHCGFLLGEPYDHNDKGQALYMAFGMNDYGKGKKYFYLGLSIAKLERNGVYYFFDCLNAFINDGYFKVDEFKDDKEAINEAINYEATLYKYTFKNDEIIDTKILYEPFSCFGGVE